MCLCSVKMKHSVKHNWEQPRRKIHTHTQRKYSSGHLKQKYQFRFSFFSGVLCIYICVMSDHRRKTFLRMRERKEEEIRLISSSVVLENIQGQKDSEGTWSPHRLGMFEAQEGRRVTPVLNSDPRPHFGRKPSEHVQSSNLHAPR